MFNQEREKNRNITVPKRFQVLMAVLSPFSHLIPQSQVSSPRHYWFTGAVVLVNSGIPISFFPPGTSKECSKQAPEC